jgi:acetylglutamate kinase
VEGNPVTKKHLIIKCGGSILAKLPKAFYQTIHDLNRGTEWQPILVHGGGPHITTLLEKLEVPSLFNNGLRVTTNEVLDIVEMVLCGSVNKQIVRELAGAGANAIGVSGMDAEMFVAEPLNEKELGFVGEIVEVNPAFVKQVSELGYIPVVAPLAKSRDGQRYNVNGDLAAAALAKALNGDLCFISNIDGVWKEEQGIKTIFQTLTPEEVEGLIQEQVIQGGMIPKVKAAVECLVTGVGEVVILNGMKEASLKAYAEGHPVGTKFVREKIRGQNQLAKAGGAFA